MKKLIVATIAAAAIGTVYAGVSQAASTFACSPEAPCAPGSPLLLPETGAADNVCPPGYIVESITPHKTGPITITYLIICVDPVTGHRIEAFVDESLSDYDATRQPAEDDGVYQPGVDPAPPTDGGLYTYDYATDTYSEWGC